VARRVASEYPKRRAVFVVSDREVGFNPKVNNLANMITGARHEIVLISDSNVAVSPEHLSELVAELIRPGVGLVTSPIRAVGGTGLGDGVEGLQLNTFVMGGVAAVTLLARKVCSVGKSMMLRRADLERIGGFDFLGRFLAEDQVCAEEIRDLGLEVRVGGRPVDQHIGRISVGQFADRHLRWARIRCHMEPLAYLFEPLTNPIIAATVLLLVVPGVAAGTVLATTLLFMGAAAFSAERLVGIRRKPWVYPPLEFLRAMLIGLLWAIPFFSSSVNWRGNRLRVGRRTLLRPVGLLEWPEPDELRSEEAVA
jgi:ceramide glucosyltransferase